MSVGFGLPTKSLQRRMKLHINCIEFGQPWASIPFMLNISEKYEMEITFPIRAFFPKLCRDALIPIHQSRTASVWSPRLLSPCWEVYPALAVRPQLWVALPSTAPSLILLPPNLCLVLTLFLFLRSIAHKDHKTNHQKKKKNGVLVDAKIGVSVSWVVQGRNKTLMQKRFTTDSEKTCLLLLPEIHIFIPAISVLFPKQP